MATWVMCKLALDHEKVVYVNLDQIVSMSDRGIGTELKYGVSDEQIFVADTAIDVLAKAGIVPSA